MYLRYNTAAHAIFSFKEKDSKYSCMPRLQNLGESDSYTYEDFVSPTFYRSTGNGFRTEVINRTNLIDTMGVSDTTTVNSLPIFDLYSSVENNPASSNYNKYGGKNARALYDNT